MVDRHTFWCLLLTKSHDDGQLLNHQLSTASSVPDVVHAPFVLPDMVPAMQELLTEHQPHPLFKRHELYTKQQQNNSIGQRVVVVVGCYL